VVRARRTLPRASNALVRPGPNPPPSSPLRLRGLANVRGWFRPSIVRRILEFESILLPRVALQEPLKVWIGDLQGQPNEPQARSQAGGLALLQLWSMVSAPSYPSCD